MLKTYSPGPFTEPENDTLGQVYEKTVNAKIELDPVGKEDGDVDNDGDKDSTDNYLMKKRKAIGKAIAKQKTSKKESVKMSNETDKVEVHKGVEEEAINEVLSKRDLHDFSQQLLSYSRKHGGIDKEYFEKIASIAAAGKIPTPDDVDNDTDPRDFVLSMMSKSFPKQVMQSYKGVSPSFDMHLRKESDESYSKSMEKIRHKEAKKMLKPGEYAKIKKIQSMMKSANEEEVKEMSADKAYSAMDKAEKQGRGEMSVTDPKKAAKRRRQAQKFADYSIRKTLNKEELEVFEACWDSHKQVGMKKKGNKMVPNCVPKNEENEQIEEKFDVKYAKTKFGKITVKSFDSHVDAKAHLDSMNKRGFKGIISQGGKPVKEEQDMKPLSKKERANLSHGDLIAMGYSKKQRKKLMDTKEETEINEATGNELKKYMKEKWNTDVKASKVGTGKSMRVVGNIPNDFREHVAKQFYPEAKILDKKNIDFGNIRPNYVSLRVGMWDELLKEEVEINEVESAYADKIAAFKKAGGTVKKHSPDHKRIKQATDAFKQKLAKTQKIQARQAEKEKAEKEANKEVDEGFPRKIIGKVKLFPKVEAHDTSKMKIPSYANRKTAQAEKKAREAAQRKRAGLDEVIKRSWKKGTYHVKDADGKIHGTYKSGSHASKAMHKLMDKGDHKELEVSRANEEFGLDEARKSDYQLYHKDFSSAMQHAYAVAKKRGYTVDKDDIDNKVATGPRKPSSGKTNRYILGTDKKQNLHVQVANLDNKRFELNMYIESVEGKDMEISEKGRLKLEKVLENRKKFVEPENRAGDHGTDELTKNYKEMTPGEEVTEGNIVANSRDPFRIFEHMVHYLMGTSIKNIEDYTFYKMEDVDNHIRLENKEGALCSIYLADVQNFFDDKDISMEDFISMITEFGVKELTEKENSVIGDEGTPAVGKEKMGQGIYTTAPPKTFESMNHYSEFISKNVEIQKNGFVSTK